MSNHECVIGSYHESYGSELVTLYELKEKIRDRIAYNKAVRTDSLFCDVEGMYKKEWDLKDYGDLRKSTNLTHFKFCPYCGKKIDWREVRNG